LATAISLFPSPLKSPEVHPTGANPTEYVVCGKKHVPCDFKAVGISTLAMAAAIKSKDRFIAFIFRG
jgi:hypothetical protein